MRARNKWFNFSSPQSQLPKVILSLSLTQSPTAHTFPNSSWLRGAAVRRTEFPAKRALHGHHLLIILNTKCDTKANNDWQEFRLPGWRYSSVKEHLSSVHETHISFKPGMVAYAWNPSTQEAEVYIRSSRQSLAWSPWDPVSKKVNKIGKCCVGLVWGLTLLPSIDGKIGKLFHSLLEGKHVLGIVVLRAASLGSMRPTVPPLLYCASLPIYSA